MNPDHIKTIREKMETYFSTVTPEQLEADLKKADFDFYNSIVDSPVVHDPNEKIYQYKDGDKFWWKIVISSPIKRSYDIIRETHGDSTLEILKYPVTIYRDNIKVFFDYFSYDDQFYYIPTVDEIMTRYSQYIIGVSIGFTKYGKVT
jgi:hypothetical protein